MARTITIDRETAQYAIAALRVAAIKERREAKSRQWQGDALKDSRARKRARATEMEEAANGMVRALLNA